MLLVALEFHWFVIKAITMLMWLRLTFRSFIKGAIKLTVCILRIIKASATHSTRVFVAFF